MNDTLRLTLSILGVLVAAIILGLLVITPIVWLICWAFGIAFSWKYIIGIWAIALLYNLAKGR